jgi:hypothetical protein
VDCPTTAVDAITIQPDEFWDKCDVASKILVNFNYFDHRSILTTWETLKGNRCLAMMQVGLLDWNPGGRLRDFLRYRELFE